MSHQVSYDHVLMKNMLNHIYIITIVYDHTLKKSRGEKDHTLASMFFYHTNRILRDFQCNDLNGGSTVSLDLVIDPFSLRPACWEEI